MNFVDLALDIPARTPSGWVSAEQDFAADVGVAAALGFYRAPRADLVLHTGLHLSSRGYGDFKMATWEVPAEVGWRWSTAGQHALVKPYWELGGGPRLMLLLVSWMPPFVDAGLTTHTGLGFTIGRGEDLRAVVGVRGSFTLGADVIDGHVTLPDGDVSWDWSPMGARLDGYAGVSFR